MPGKYTRITYDERTRQDTYTRVDRVDGVAPEIFPQLELLGELMPNVVNVTRWSSRAGEQEPRFHDKFHEMIIVIKGQGTFAFGRKKVPVQARDVVLVKPGELHCFVDQSRFECIAVHFSLTALTRRVKKSRHGDAASVPVDEFLSFVARYYPKIRKVTMAEGSRIITKAEETLQEFEGTGPGANLMTSLAALELLVMVARNYLFAEKGVALNREQVKERDRILVGQVQAHIRRNYMHPLNVDDLFAPFFLHPNYCRNIFKAATGTSVRSFILETRMNAARSRILDTDNTLEAIADTCGFNDYFYFLRAFKKTFGVTAGSLRKKTGF